MPLFTEKLYQKIGSGSDHKMFLSLGMVSGSDQSNKVPQILAVSCSGEWLQTDRRLKSSNPVRKLCRQTVDDATLRGLFGFVFFLAVRGFLEMVTPSPGVFITNDLSH